MGAKRLGREILHIIAAFWRSLTAPVWLPAWERLCAETGAELLPPAPWRAGRVRAKHRCFNLDLTSWVGSDTSGTALRTDLSNPTGFKFFIRRRGTLDGVLGVFAGTPFQTGWPDFDQAFHVTGNSDEVLGRLLRDAALRDSIARQSDVSLTLAELPIHRTGRLTRLSGDGVNRLTVEATEAITDSGRLRSLFDLHREVLDALSEAGVISAVVPMANEPDAEVNQPLG